MPHERRWRQFRLSTLIFLVIIAGLALALVADRFNRAREARQSEARVQQALAEAQYWAVQARRLAQLQAAAVEAGPRKPQNPRQDLR
jgi:hypothetical protein